MCAQLTQPFDQAPPYATMLILPPPAVSTVQRLCEC